LPARERYARDILTFSKGEKTMTYKECGGPAYPVVVVTDLVGGASIDWTTYKGMTLRDYFAGQALQGIISNGGYDNRRAQEDAYKYADAMLEARKT
jgi:hypothetical protein